MLGSLRHQWCPEAMVVSFKLETDDALLIGKVRWAAVWVGGGGRGCRELGRVHCRLN